MDKQDEKDVESIKLVPLHTRQRLARKNKQDEKDVEFIKRFPLHPRQWLIRKTQKLKHPRDKLKEKELQIARNNVLVLMRKKIDFTAKKLLNKILLFDSSRVNEELIMDKTIENLPGETMNSISYASEPGTNSFSLRREGGQ